MSRRSRRHRHAQTAVEYVLLTIAAAAALAYMFSYVRSAASGRLKSGADSVGHGLLYPP